MALIMIAIHEFPPIKKGTYTNDRNLFGHIIREKKK
jgi:hypothetical protein